MQFWSTPERYRPTQTKCALIINALTILTHALTRLKQVAQLSHKDRAAEWLRYGQKWKTGTGKQYLRTIRSIFNHCDVFGQQEIEIGENAK